MELIITHLLDLVDYLQQMIQPFTLQEDKHMSLIISLVVLTHSKFVNLQVVQHIAQVLLMLVVVLVHHLESSDLKFHLQHQTL